MISDFHKVNKWPLGEWLVGEVLMRPALRRAFRGVYAWIDPATLKLSKDKDISLIFCATHSGWWDGHMAFILDRQAFHRDPLVMMEEKQLARYGFFTWIGAFGVVREEPRAAITSLQYAADLLTTRPNSTLWMFPQGAMAQPDARPLQVFGGAANIARRLERCALVPVALRYDFLREQAPSALARVGAPILVSRSQSVSPREVTRQLADSMTACADTLRDDVYAHGILKYKRILTGRGSVNSNWDRIQGVFMRAIGR